MENKYHYLILTLAVLNFLVFSSLQISSPWPESQVFTGTLIDKTSKELSSKNEELSSQKKTIAEKIEQGKEFLYRMEHPELHGFYKRYDTPNDYLASELHAVYSASIIYTFLYIYDYDKDEKILTRLSEWGDFLLSMQDKESGAFHYRCFLETEFPNGNSVSCEKEQRFVVGTSALSIFTLLRLYEFTGQEKYLESAKSAGDWLITMQREDGVMKPYKRYEDEKWLYGKKESLLYNGQCLSALSKLYNATGIQKYYEAAEKIANHFAQKYEQAGRQYIVGEYRTKNPISNSWVVMSLMDFYHAFIKKSSGELSSPENYKDIVFELSSQIISHQEEDGKINGAFSTSGNGWISEVMIETYRFCLEQERDDCEKYKETVVKIINWVMERTYSKENSSSLPNPERAMGGVFWNEYEKYVRTDSVCHALNGYVRIIDFLE